MVPKKHINVYSLYSYIYIKLLKFSLYYSNSYLEHMPWLIKYLF